ncbi:MAG: glycosyl transferase family 90 [Bacteroidota bacterium]
MLRNPWTHKNIKFFYYLNGVLLEGQRKIGWQSSLEGQLKKLKDVDLETLRYRLNYYHKSLAPFTLSGEAFSIKDLTLPPKNKTYYFDLLANAVYFPQNYALGYQFGDVREVPTEPLLVKSRPIVEDNENSILLKFNKIRHYTFVQDTIDYRKKTPKLIGRASVKQEHRRQFFRQYFDHPLCDLGQINAGTTHDQWLKPKISINEHLRYKFILCQEGNDVASNLKWVMSSNSLAVMPRPKFETWFMEGQLEPNVHYVAIEDDFSDLEERLQYYLAHENEAQNIIANANAYFDKFRDKTMEKLLGLLVLERYFYRSGQLTPVIADLHQTAT